MALGVMGLVDTTALTMLDLTLDMAVLVGTDLMDIMVVTLIMGVFTTGITRIFTMGIMGIFIMSTMKILKGRTLFLPPAFSLGLVLGL